MVVQGQWREKQRLGAGWRVRMKGLRRIMTWKELEREHWEFYNMADLDSRRNTNTTEGMVLSSMSLQHRIYLS